MNARRHFLCLCPIWNHRHETTQSAIACFLEQRLPENTKATLLLLDDRPEELCHAHPPVVRIQRQKWYRSHRGTVNHIIHSQWFPRKCESLGEKYRQGIAAIEALSASFEYDLLAKGPYYTHYAIWDDDDLFLPGHLESAVACYESDPAVKWTYPDTVFSTYGNNVQIETTGGRFWSSVTMDAQYLKAVGGFEQGLACGHDQINLGKLTNGGGKRGVPQGPTYIYRWGAEQESHASGHATGFWDESWYSATRPSNSNRMPYSPYMDENAVWAFSEIAKKFPEVHKRQVFPMQTLSFEQQELDGHARFG